MKKVDSELHKTVTSFSAGMLHCHFLGFSFKININDTIKIPSVVKNANILLVFGSFSFWD